MRYWVQQHCVRRTVGRPYAAPCSTHREHGVGQFRVDGAGATVSGGGRRADPEEFASYFTDDAVWWRAPWQAVKGRDAIRETLRRGAEQLTALPWEVRYIVGDGDVALTERVDNFIVGDTRVCVPCMGIFELKA